ncbi:hypothetical protein AK830_g7463 [Neonectria ditissima]|uniref:Uncharacterized protein n=1 Tax=Neonectria ditissima TaxID=78410 RepID=A0A0P7AZK8_9HYPO|nr:hypothetical protein AK830_g7463 [Neonectria ditissima]
MAAMVRGEAPRAIEFTTIEKLFEEMHCTVGDVLHVRGVSAQQFAEIDVARGEQSSPRFHRFDASSQTLTVTIPTPLHECLHEPLLGAINQGISYMGLFNAWHPMGSPMLRATQSLNDDDAGVAGESDSSGGPNPERCGDSWPTLVMEAGHLQTLSGLRKKMRWLFKASNHQVKIVVLAKVEHEEGIGKITIEKYIEVPVRILMGAIATRTAARLQPICNQIIEITQGPSNFSSYIARTALRLEFKLLFLRSPRRREGDVMIRIPQLQEYAGDIWSTLERSQ